MHLQLSPFITKIAVTVAASAVLGGGTMVLNNARETAVLSSKVENTDSRLTRIEEKTDKVLELLAGMSR
jgi:hypothetical protein